MAAWGMSSPIGHNSALFFAGRPVYPPQHGAVEVDQHETTARGVLYSPADRPEQAVAAGQNRGRQLAQSLLFEPGYRWQLDLADPRHRHRNGRPRWTSQCLATAPDPEEVLFRLHYGCAVQLWSTDRQGHLTYYAGRADVRDARLIWVGGCPLWQCGLPEERRRAVLTMAEVLDLCPHVKTWTDQGVQIWEEEFRAHAPRRGEAGLRKAEQRS